VKCYNSNPCACEPFCDHVFYPRRSLAPLLGTNLVVRLRSVNIRKEDLPSGKKGGKAKMLFVWIDLESDRPCF
jgi:hypothetical protein